MAGAPRSSSASGARRARGACASASTAPARSRSCSRRRAPERAAARGGARAGALDRAPPPHARPRRRGGRAPGGHGARSSASELRLVPAAGPHARPPPRRRAARARTATRGRRSSAGTGAPARAEIGPRLDAAVARAGTTLHGPDDPRPAHALGVVLVRPAPCRSTGGCCSRPRRCSTTSSSTRSATSRCMDHSPRFWALLESRVPGLARARALAAALRVDARPLADNGNCALRKGAGCRGGLARPGVRSLWRLFRQTPHTPAADTPNLVPPSRR